MTAGMRVRGLDGLRGVAILLVVAYHVDSHRLRYGGTVGVTLFFVLSGFLITSLLLDEDRRNDRIDLRAFYIRRALRLYPALLLAVAGATVLMAVTGALDGEFAAAATSAVLYVTDFVQAFTSQDFAVLGHTWSLAVEEQFYLLWPLALIGVLAWARKDRRRLLVGVLTLAAIAVAWHVAGTVLLDFRRVYYGPDTNAFGLLLGCALAVYPRQRRILPPWMTGVALALIVGLAVLPSVDFNGADRTIQLWVALGTAFAGVLAVEASRDHAFVLAWRPLAYIGQYLSYSWYLWHVILRDVTADQFGDSRALRAAAVLVALGVAWLSWTYVEEPILRRKKRFERGRLETQAADQAARYRTTLP